MTNEIHNLQTQINALQQRNQKVEMNKEWEMSLSRKIILSMLIYISVCICFLYLKINNPFLNAVIPTLAFMISTASMSWAKDIWLNKFYKGT